MDTIAQQAKRIFVTLLKEIPTDEWDARLDSACGGDQSVRDLVSELLAAHLEARSFMEAPAAVLLEAEQADNGLPESPPSSDATLDLSVTERPGTAIGPYKIREKIGEGGMGVVYVAEQTQPVQRKVALKIIKPGMDTQEVVARFEAERQALAFMEHPNIARVLEAGATDSGRPFFVMELVRGIPITEYCDQAQLSPHERLELFTTVCDAVQHAHQKGIIHRDIKPSNVLVTQVSAKPIVKVIDFGLAKATSGQRLTEKTVYTGFMRLMGTPVYMSPEQAGLSGQDVDTRSDIYSLGVLLYELLTGTTPLDRMTLQQQAYDELCRQIREVEAPKPSVRISTLNDDACSVIAQQRHADPKHLSELLRGDLDRVVLKALEKDRDRRYETSKDLADDIDRFLHDRPVLAVPPSPSYLARKYFRRHKVAIVTATTIFSLLILATVFSSWQAIRATRAERVADEERDAAVAAKQAAQSSRDRADAQSHRASESERRARRLQYASDINLAQQALDSNDLGKVRRLLERHWPHAGEEDLRGWEWRYLWQLTRGNALEILATQQPPGGSISFSPDGTRLAVAWADGRVDLWDVPGRRLDRTLQDLIPPGGRVTFSPVGNLLAATTEPGMVTLHDLDSDQESILWRAPDGAPWHVHDFVFSKDGSMVVVRATLSQIGAVGEVWLVDLSSSDNESRHITVGEDACISPDNRRLYVIRLDLSDGRPRPGQGSSLYGYIQCIELRTGEEVWRTPTRRAIGLASLDISPDGRLLASGSNHEDPTIRVWDADSGQLLRPLDGHTGAVGVLFTPDGRRLVSGSADQTIRIWDTGTWTETKLLRGHTGGISDMAISEPEQLIASVGYDGNLMLWKEDGPGKEGYIRLPADGLYDVRELNLNHSRLLLVPPDKTPELVDLKGDTPSIYLPQIEPFDRFQGWPHSSGGSDIVFHWKGGKQIVVHELRGEQLVQSRAIPLHSAACTKLIYNPRRQLLAWSEEAFPMSVFVASLAERGRRMELKSDIPNIVPWRFSEDGRFLVGPTKGQSAGRAWNVETGQIVASMDGKGWDVHFAAGGRVLVASLERGRDHEIGFFDLEHPDQPARRVPGPGHSRMLAISRDGGLVACATLGGQVRLYDPFKGELVASFHGHLTQAYGVAFSPDGKRLISTASGREAVKLWDVSTRQELLTLKGDGSYLYSAGWLGDGDVILVGAPWQAWRAPSWEEIAAAEQAEAKD